MKLFFENLSAIESKHGLSSTELQSTAKNIPPYLQNIEAQNQGFYKIIDDTQTVKRILEKGKTVEDAYDEVVVLGIGGSALGTICLKQSLQHLFEDLKKERNVPRLHVLDNIDPVLLSELEEIIDLKRTLFIVVTKSGSTPETLAQFLYFREKCLSAKLPISGHFVVITEANPNLLRRMAEEDTITTFEIPETVGGRFSVLTAVGLVPAALIGIDIEKLLEGARSMRDSFLNENFDHNLPFQLATIQYLLSQKGKTINVMMPYSQKLIRFADWWKQLLAESIGKRVDRTGKEVLVGITPVNALGVTDQHSQSQLYNEGPNDKLHIFLKVNDHGPELKIPSPPQKFPELDYLKDVSFNHLLQTEMEGTIQSLTKNHRPNITLEIDAVNEYTLGEFFMLFEATTAFLGEFFNINAFDQPGVELGKQITKQLLKK